MGGGTRWWENYLVRYFMPSIAGIIAVNWLTAIAGDGFRELLRLPKEGKPLDGTSLTLLILYGNLFCYVASYPILVFHATRVLDFHGKETRWLSGLTDGYLLTIALGLISLIATTTLSNQALLITSFVLAMVFASLQLLRLRQSLSLRWKVEGLKEESSPMFSLAYALARRRGLKAEKEATKSVPGASASNPSGRASDPDLDEGVNSRSVKLVVWRAELIDTYRHMREHGNSAFIFLLELVLAGLLYGIVGYQKFDVEEKLSAIGVLLAVWALPSMFVHMAAQHLERRFSQLERRM